MHLRYISFSIHPPIREQPGLSPSKLRAPGLALHSLFQGNRRIACHVRACPSPAVLFPFAARYRAGLRLAIRLSHSPHYKAETLLQAPTQQSQSKYYHRAPGEASIFLLRLLLRQGKKEAEDFRPRPSISRWYRDLRMGGTRLELVTPSVSSYSPHVCPCLSVCINVTKSICYKDLREFIRNVEHLVECSFSRFCYDFVTTYFS